MPGEQPTNTRKLIVDLSGLKEALENHSFELAYFFDLETSEIVLITDEVNGDLRKLYKELDDTRLRARAPCDRGKQPAVKCYEQGDL